MISAIAPQHFLLSHLVISVGPQRDILVNNPPNILHDLTLY